MVSNHGDRILLRGRRDANFASHAKKYTLGGQCNGILVLHRGIFRAILDSLKQKTEKGGRFDVRVEVSLF